MSGKVVAYGRLSLTRGFRIWRFVCITFDLEKKHIKESLKIVDHHSLRVRMRLMLLMQSYLQLGQLCILIENSSWQLL